MAASSSSSLGVAPPTRRLSDYQSLSDEMKTVVKNTLQNVVERTHELFGENSTFVKFNENHCVGRLIRGINSTILCGTISFTHQTASAKECGKSVSVPFMLKLTPRRMSFREFHLYSFANEMYFYTQIVPFFNQMRDTSDLFAKYYSGQMQVNNDGLNAVIVLESLRTHGYHPPHRKSFLEYPQLAMMMQKLGQFHAYSYQARRLMSSERAIYGETVGEFPGLVNMFADTQVGATLRMDHFLSKVASRGIVKLAKYERYQMHLPLINRYNTQADEYVMRVLSGDRHLSCSVLCHGDYIATNTVFKNQDDTYTPKTQMDMKILDFTGCKFASPVVDLALVLYMNADQDMRNKRWDDLINVYYDAMTFTFEDNKESIPSKQEILREFIGKAPYAYFVASYFLPTLIAIDNHDDLKQHLPQQYPNWNYAELPEKYRVKYCERVGGEKATKALVDILKDMLDRGFFTPATLR